MRTVDLVVVGIVVGASGVAALGIADAGARILLMTALGLGAGTIATVSQRVGGGQREAADAAVAQSLLLAVAIGVPFTVAGLVGADAYFRVLGASAEVAAIGATYLRIVIATAVPRAVAIMLTRALQGAGDTRTPLVIRSIGTGTNVVLTVLLVAGLGPFPQLGVPGAALGTAIGNVLSASLLIGVLVSGRRVVALRRTGWWAPATARRIVTIGAPQVLERNLFAVASLPLNAIVLTFGTVANAGFQVGRRIQLYALLPSRGVATAVSATMGQSVGRRRSDDGHAHAVGGIWMAALVTAALAVPMFLLAAPLADVVVHTPDAIAAAATWVRVYALVTVLRAVYGVLRGAMQGAGDTRSPLTSTALGIGVFLLGFSWLVGVRLGMGLGAVMAGVALDPGLRLLVLGRWFAAGRWRRFLGAAERDLAPVG
jgi:putative MATE family efflux protein